MPVSRNLLKKLKACQALILGTSFAFLGTVPAFSETYQFIIDKTAETLRNLIETSVYQDVFTAAGETVYSPELLRHLYENRIYSPAWTDNEGPKPHIESLIKGLEDVRPDGLNPEYYHLNKINTLLAAISERKRRNMPLNIRVLADLELLLSDAFLTCGSHLLNGLVNPETIDPEWHITRKTFDLATTFEDAVKTGLFREALGNLRPIQAEYSMLRNTLAHYREIGDEEMIRRIEVNMERWRWLPQEQESRYIQVNIADFELNVIENGATVLNMRAIVGKPFRRTPVFKSKMTYLVLNPSWDVPPTIALEDILPEVQKDPGYIEKHNFKILQGWGSQTKAIDSRLIVWSNMSAKNFNYRFRQGSGPANQLGRIKFMFPNPFHVYIHDTPSRHLFDQTERVFSSGCIRIEKPLELAEYILADNKGWNRKRLLAEIKKGAERTVRLKTPIAVYFVYWTAWPDKNGQVRFRNDIYGRDKQLLEAISQQPPQK